MFNHNNKRLFLLLFLLQIWTVILKIKTL